MPVLNKPSQNRTSSGSLIDDSLREDPAAECFEMDESTLVANDHDAEHSHDQKQKTRGPLGGIAKHTLGLILLLCVVFLWTLSNFLGSSIFADNSYAKPFFLTYLNTSFFTLCVIPRLVWSGLRKSREGILQDELKSMFTTKGFRDFWRGEGQEKGYISVSNDEEDSFFSSDNAKISTSGLKQKESGNLGLVATARLALSFCILWFLANYFAMSCLQFTTVASTTILTSTSSIWTLLIGALTRTEKFTWKKLCGVLASLAGIALISQVDFGAGTDHAGTVKRALDEFPDKTPYELALGDALALLSAVIYGFYTIILKKATISALPETIHMPTFFGFVGIFNVVLLFPFFPVLHFSGLERFSLPPDGHIWLILLINSVSSLLSDICWAYAMVFTSPLVATVGLSLTIPVSLVGEMIIQGRFESWLYWIGAMIVVGSFVFVEREEKHEEEEESDGGRSATGGREDDGDLGEPGPAIVIEDYDEMQEELTSARTREPDRRGSPALLDDEGDEDVR